MQTKYKTDDLRICATKEVIAPDQVHNEMPISEAAAKTTLQARQDIHNILVGKDDRLVVVVGPCSIHETAAAQEYARLLKVVNDELKDDLLITSVEEVSINDTVELKLRDGGIQSKVLKKYHDKKTII